MPNIDYMKSITFKTNGDDWIKLAVREGEEISPAWQSFTNQQRNAQIKIGKVKDVDDVSITINSIQQFVVNGHVVVIARLGSVVGDVVDPIYVLKKLNASGVNAFEVVGTDVVPEKAIAFWPWLEENGYGDYNGVIRAFLENQFVRTGTPF